MIAEEYKEHDLINTYMKWYAHGYNCRSWMDIFKVTDQIELQDGYALIMQHNTFLFKNKSTGEHMPVQTYFNEPDQRINAAHECLVKMIKYINSLK